MPANRVYAPLECPRCGAIAEQEIEATLDGQGFAQDYRVGDRIDWGHAFLPAYSGRPADGNLRADGYVVCEVCEKDFFVYVTVRADELVRVELNQTRSGMIP